MARQKVHTVVLIGWVIFVIAAGMFIFQHVRSSRAMIYSREPLTQAEEDDYAKTTGMTPEQVAKIFFEACGQEKWDEVLKFLPAGMLEKHTDFLDRLKKVYGGIQIISLGKPFKGMVKDSGAMAPYPGVWVPYEIRFKNGQTKQWNLAVRCDNAGHHWYWDGGL